MMEQCMTDTPKYPVVKVCICAAMETVKTDGSHYET